MQKASNSACCRKWNICQFVSTQRRNGKGFRAHLRFIVILGIWEAALFKKISLSERSEFEILNAFSSFPNALELHGSETKPEIPSHSFAVYWQIDIYSIFDSMPNCLLSTPPQETYLIESSKSPAVVAKSNKQWVGTCLLLNACCNDIGTCIFQDSNM